MSRSAKVTPVGFFYGENLAAKGGDTAITPRKAGRKRRQRPKADRRCPSGRLFLFALLPGQSQEEVKRYATTVMKGLRDALHYDELEKIFDLMK